jgi:type IV pilus assembly protein PilF
MKLATLSALVVGAILHSGCVTEGAVRSQPASGEEQAEVNLTLGSGYLQEGRADLALDPLLRAVEVEPRHAEAHSVLAIAYDQTGSTRLAEEHHVRAAELGPRSADIQNRFAVFLCRQNRWADARAPLRRAIDASDGPASVTVIMNAASCARGAGDLEAAEGFFREALDVDSRNADALRGMVDVSIRQTDFIQGRAFWQRLEASIPLVAQDLLSCYVIESEMSNDAAAQACADRMPQEFPGSPVLAQLRRLQANGS